MKTYSYIVWFLILACIAIAGYGTVIWYCLIGGIVQVVDAIKTTPTDSWGYCLWACKISLYRYRYSHIHRYCEKDLFKCILTGDEIRPLGNSKDFELMEENG